MSWPIIFYVENFAKIVYILIILSNIKFALKTK